MKFIFHEPFDGFFAEERWYGSVNASTGLCVLVDGLDQMQDKEGTGLVAHSNRNFCGKTLRGKHKQNYRGVYLLELPLRSHTWYMGGSNAGLCGRDNSRRCQFVWKFCSSGQVNVGHCNNSLYLFVLVE